MKTVKWLIFAAAAGSFLLSAAPRTIYVTRHGQASYKINYDKKAGEQWLTDLGREQAKRLADYLKAKGFHGIIYCSPLLRTLETASFTARAVGSPITLCPEIQEVATYDRPVPRGMNMNEILERFPDNLIRKSPAVQPGWRLYGENNKARMARIGNAWKKILAESKGDLLLVSHGGIVENLLEYLDRHENADITGRAWNCCLFIFTVNEKNQILRSEKTLEYLPKDMVTNNFRCPLVERPHDPAYMTRIQDQEDRRRRAAKKMQQEKKNGL